MKIKLRAWDTIDKVMRCNVGISINGTQVYKDDLIPERIILDRGQEVLIPMLSTGLFDKNGKGKEAYHHDIIEIWVSAPWNEEEPIRITGEIIWLNGGWWFEGKESNAWDCYLAELGDFEIIGNLHENPELIEEKE